MLQFLKILKFAIYMPIFQVLSSNMRWYGCLLPHFAENSEIIFYDIDNLFPKRITYTTFWNTQIQLENFHQYQTFYSVLWLIKFSTAPKFLWYFSDLENQVWTFQFSPSEKASPNLYESQRKWKMIFWDVNPLSMDRVPDRVLMWLSNSATFFFFFFW